MDAFLLLNSKNGDILLEKLFISLHKEVISAFTLSIVTKSINPQEGFIAKIKGHFFVFKKVNGFFFTIIVSRIGQELITSIIKILDSIVYALKSNFELTKDNLIANKVNILLMLDTYLLKGTPIFNENSVLSSIVDPYDVVDTFTEYYIGKAKSFESRALISFARETQIAYGYPYFLNPVLKSKGQEKILVDFIDLVSNANYDSMFQLQHCELGSKLKINYLVGSRIDAGISINIPFRVVNVSKSLEVKTSKEDLLKSMYFEIAPKYGYNEVLRILPAQSTKIALPFRINVKAQQTTTVNINLILIESSVIKHSF